MKVKRALPKDTNPGGGSRSIGGGASGVVGGYHDYGAPGGRGGDPTTYDSRMVMYNTQNCCIYLWDTRTNSNAWTLKIILEEDYVSFLVISPCGNWFVSRSSRGVLTLSRPKTHFKGMTIILHLKLEGLKCNLTQTIIL